MNLTKYIRVGKLLRLNRSIYNATLKETLSEQELVSVTAVEPERVRVIKESTPSVGKEFWVDAYDLSFADFLKQREILLPNPLIEEILEQKSLIRERVKVK